MRVGFCFFSLLVVLAASAVAQQPDDPVDPVGCAAQVADLERDMDLARAKGQMLRRQQLASQAAALRTRCNALPGPTGRAARIQMLEQEIAGLRARLDRAEEQLRVLKSTSQ